ncbi:uncharacterized protein METZ01_LOCUS297388 [marine metagenome]|uniref:Uncharacterized protein n=1 Tax=marine metagenome TaxID=408172 RepID=A0A382M675_9ZZZZ
MAESEIFGIEAGFAEQAIEWMNNEAKKCKFKFEARAYNYKINTENFGAFEMFSWIGDVKVARNLITKTSKRFKIRAIEGGYKTKEKLFRKTKSEYAMVRKGERVIGHLEFTKSMLGNEKWKLKAEERK